MSEAKVTPDDMIRATRSMGPEPERPSSIGGIIWRDARDLLALEFASVRAEEREACAKIADEEWQAAYNAFPDTCCNCYVSAENVAERIRERGEA